MVLFEVPALTIDSRCQEGCSVKTLLMRVRIVPALAKHKFVTRGNQASSSVPTTNSRSSRYRPSFRDSCQQWTCYMWNNSSSAQCCSRNPGSSLMLLCQTRVQVFILWMSNNIEVKLDSCNGKLMSLLSLDDPRVIHAATQGSADVTSYFVSCLDFTSQLHSSPISRQIVELRGHRARQHRPRMDDGLHVLHDVRGIWSDSLETCGFFALQADRNGKM